LVLDSLRLGHTERAQICVEDRHLLAPLVLILLTDAYHRAERLSVEAVALGLGVHLAKVGGERRPFLLKALDTSGKGAKLVFG